MFVVCKCVCVCVCVCACVCACVCVYLQQMTNRGSFMEDYSESTLNNEINNSEVKEGQ